MFRIILGYISTAEVLLVAALLICYWVLPGLIGILTIITLVKRKQALHHWVYILSVPVGIASVYLTWQKFYVYNSVLVTLLLPLLIVSVCCLLVWLKARRVTSS